MMRMEGGSVGAKCNLERPESKAQLQVFAVARWFKLSLHRTDSLLLAFNFCR